jgi:hypothetical protein
MGEQEDGERRLGEKKKEKALRRGAAGLVEIEFSG